MRHLVVIDFRENVDFKQAHLSRATRAVDMQNCKKVLLEQFRSPKNASKYDNDDLTRVLFVLPRGDSALFNQLQESLVDLDAAIVVNTQGLANIHKAYFTREFDEKVQP